MNINKLISVSLMIFVVFSILFLIYKEFVRSNYNRATTLNEVHSHNSPDTSAQKSDTPPIQKSLSISKKDSLSREIDSKQKRTVPTVHPNPQFVTSKVIAYYFHGTHRCTTCLTIERYSRKAIEKYFSQEIREGILEFKPLNVEEPENRHYIQDYQLVSSSLVISLVKQDKEVTWKNLIDVWKHVRDKDRFFQYVKDEVYNFIKEI